MIGALLVDDEPNLTKHLQRLLGQCWPELEILGVAHNGREALAKVASLSPDLIFLDIRMPGLSGLQVAGELPRDVHVVFITAYDEYAVNAFEVAAADYLLKPVTAERLTTTIERVQSLLATNTAPEVELQKLVAQLKGDSPSYLQWLRAGLGDTTQLVPINDVVYFQADKKYTSVMTPDQEHLVRMSIKELEQQLDPNQFWRIHRGIIVNVNDIQQAQRDLRGRYKITLKRRQESLRSSQSYNQVFKQM